MAFLPKAMGEETPCMAMLPQETKFYHDARKAALYLTLLVKQRVGA
jgi:hypothetical protein